MAAERGAGPDQGGRLAANVMRFCRVLRAAGLPVGPGRVLTALAAVEAVGVGRRDDFYWALHATLVDRRDQREIFDQAFHIFWRNPDLLRRMMALMLPAVRTPPSEEQRPVNRRLADALAPERLPGQGPDDGEPPTVDIDAAFTVSERELLQSRDFEQMSAEELERARRLISSMRLPIRERRTRRFRADPRGPSVDLRRTLRASLRGGGSGIDLARRRRRTRPPPLVVICDISGSMSQYSRMLLHFLHAVTSDRDRVHSFVFGTRLTNITRQLRARDVDEALAKVGEVVLDWSGGTRIAECLHEFNRRWSRRVLGQGAVVLLITDGLERDAPERLGREMDRLHKSSRRLIWLNPLLRFGGYAPRSQGARAMMPHVDEFRSAHSLDSLDDLVRLLGEDRGNTVDRAALGRWREAAAADAAHGA